MDMEKKPEELKFVHSQHARILKEDEEFWISSEDLNTENSSDDDRSKAKHACKKKLKLKDRKRSSPNIRLQRPSIPSVASTSKALDDRLLMPAAEDLNARSTDDSRTSDEEYQIPPITSECLSKRLSLEDWRPMKGALNITSLEEVPSSAADARKIVNETENFYNAMLDKLKSLKSCSVLKSTRKEISDVSEKLPGAEKTFKYLKNTPEVRRKLDFINRLDEEINETISRYKAERTDRLSTELEMCQSINDYKLSEERDTERFLQMCNFEGRMKKYREQSLAPAPKSPQAIEKCLETETFQDADSKCFIRKNFYAAREGFMAGFSITDEEKAKIADILKDIDDFELGDGDLALTSPSKTIMWKKQEDDEEIAAISTINGFVVTQSDQIRMGEIDSELEKFLEDQNSQEKLQKTLPVIRDDEFWKQYALDQSLKEIDAQLKKLCETDAEDDQKLGRNKAVLSDT